MGQITATFKPNATVGKDAPIMKFDNDCIATITTETLANRNYGAEIINGDTCTDCMKLCLGDVPRKVAEINTETEEIFVPKGVVPLGDEVGEMPGRETLKAVPNPNSGECSLYFDANESDFASVELYDSEGRTVLLQNIEIKKGKNSFDLDCSQCKSGIYTIVIKGNTTNLSQKINVIKKS
ncbi:MAG: T9SS type A sorting domain-containing protein [Bacteroidales bacterium]|nr:T9SS type A sorting domain-containing protein [Bacteroidales bacterium]